MTVDSTPSLCPGVGPCSPWSLSLSCLDDAGDLADGCSIDGTPVPPETLDAAVLSASQVVWALTGRQFSTCDVTVRPCRRECDESGYGPLGWVGWNTWSGPFPVKLANGWFNLACGCGTSCSCGNISEVNLPYPVCDVSEVMVDGVALDPGAYKVDNYRKLVRTDGLQWPRCNDFSLPDSEVGTWSVSLTYGKEPPQIALDAAAELACERIKSDLGKTCRLPSRTAKSFGDPMAFFKELRTGMFLIDLAVLTFNPRHLARAPGVYSPDAEQWRVTTS